PPTKSHAAAKANQKESERCLRAASLERPSDPENKETRRDRYQRTLRRSLSLDDSRAAVPQFSLFCAEPIREFHLYCAHAPTRGDPQCCAPAQSSSCRGRATHRP